MSKKLGDTSRTLVFDIETDGLYANVSNFWVGYTYCIETKEYNVYRDVDRMVESLNEATTLVGHNIIGYDIPVLDKLSTGQLDPSIKVIDTLILGKLAYYDQDRSFSHSLEAYGMLLGFPKGEYSDWSKYTPEMDIYCKRDVEVTTKLLTHLRRKTRWLPQQALELEQEVQRIITQQTIRGWCFDTKKAQALHIELIKELEDARKVLSRTFVPMVLPKGKTKVPKRAFTRLGITTVGEHQPVELMDFNPGSGKHIVTWITRLYGTQPFPLTEKGTPKTDSTTLKQMFGTYSWATPLLHYLEVQKLLGQLAEGPKAWLKLEEGGRIYGQADILGAVTGRFTHSNPNLAQVPSIGAYKGAESRALFTVKEGYKLVGADASGLELRTLSHYLGRHDGGAYGQLVLTGDIHTANQQAAGLGTRDQAKTFIYAFLYGAGDAKIGSITGGGSKAGATLKRAFTTQVRGLDRLIDGVKKAAKRKYLVGLSGRRLYIRSPHSALNTLLQAAGATYMKYWLVYVDRMIKEKGYDASPVGNIHDESQFEVAEKDVENFSADLEKSFIIVGEQIGMRIKMEGEVKSGRTWKDTH